MFVWPVASPGIPNKGLDSLWSFLKFGIQPFYPNIFKDKFLDVCMIIHIIWHP